MILQAQADLWVFYVVAAQARSPAPRDSHHSSHYSVGMLQESQAQV